MRARRAVLAGACCALLAACASTPAPTSTEPTIPATATSDVGAQDRSLLRTGGSVRLRMSAIPDQWNPLHPDGASPDVRTLTDPLTAPAFTTDAAGRVTPNPDLLADAEVSTDEATHVVLTLNQDAQWGDGAPVTADDWIATWRAKSGQIPGIKPAETAGWDRVASVTQGNNEYSVVIDYTDPDPAWQEPLVAGPLRAASTVDADAFSWESFDAAHYVGPYLVSHVDETQGIITLDPNPAWRGDPPLLDHVIFRTLPDEEAPAAFRSNELDLLAVGVAEDVAERLRGDTTATLREAPAPAGRQLTVKTSGILGDVTVRQAVLRALDRKAIAKTDLAGLHASGTEWSHPLLLPNQPGYSDQAKATGLSYDPARANELLEQAGWTMGDTGIRERDGVPLTVSFAVDSDPWSITEAALIATQLKEIGIRVNAVSEDADLTPVTVPASNFPLAHLPHIAWNDDELAPYATRINSEMDLVRRVDQANQLSYLMWQRVDTIPLFQPPEVAAVRAGLANIGSGGFAGTAWEDVGWRA